MAERYPAMARGGCVVTRPDLPEEMFAMLRSQQLKVDVWPETTTIPREALLRLVAASRPVALVCTLSDKIDGPVLDAAGNKLKVVATLSVGFDHIDVLECRKRGILVTNTPGVLTDACAELTIALLLATARKLFQAERALRNGQWAPGWNHMWMCGSSIKNSTIGIIGMGRIGLAIAQRLTSFQPAKMLYSGNTAKDYAMSIGALFVPLDQLLGESDFVIVCCSLTEKTRNLLDSRTLAMMKPSAILVNTSRGGIVDQDSLLEVLRKNKIAGAGLDVMAVEPIPLDDPLLALDNVVLLPHIGSATTETRTEMARAAARNVLVALEGSEPPPGLVSLD